MIEKVRIFAMSVSETTVVHELKNPAHSVKVEALGARGPGGAFMHYRIVGGDKFALEIPFQSGPMDDAVTGATNEALAAVVCSRLDGFLTGPFADEYTREALQHFRKGVECLNQRAADRAARGVTGKLTK